MKLQGLDLDDAPQFEKLLKPFQIIGWGLITCFIVAAMAGLFGKSQWTRKEIKTAMYSVEYPKFVRREADEDFVVIIRGSPKPSLWVSNDYLREVELRTISPEPEKVVAEGLGQRFYFSTSESPSVSEKTILEVGFYFRPKTGGRLSGQLQVNGESKIEIEQLSYY